MTSIPEQRAAIQRAELARFAASELESFLQADDDEELKITVAGRSGDQVVTVPRSAVGMLVELLEALSWGREPSVVPVSYTHLTLPTTERV